MPNVITTKRILSTVSGEINVTCPAITPTLGAELLVNPGFEGTYAGGLAPNWTKRGTCTPSESADVTGGTAAQGLTASADAVDEVYQSPANAAGDWFQGSIYGKKTGGGGSFRIQIGTLSISGSDVAYAQKLGTFRSGGGHDFHINNSDLTCTSIFDDASLKKITFPSCLVYLGKRVRSGTYTCKPTLTANTQCGLAVGYADAVNLVLAYHDGTNAKLEKCIAGTWTSVISDVAAYSAAATLKIVVAADGINYSLYYNGSQVGATTSITNSGLGLGVYGFSAYASNTVGLVSTSLAVV